MYNATIESKKFDKGVIQVGVIYSDGNDKFTEVYGVSSSEELDTIICGRLKTFNEVKNISISTGSYTKPVDSTDSALVEFRRSIKFLETMKKLIDLGVKGADDSDYIDLVSLAKSQFKSEYLDKII